MPLLPKMIYIVNTVVIKKKKKNLPSVQNLTNSLMCLHVCSVMSDSFATLWTVAHQAPLSMGFSRQEYWSGLPFSPPGDLPDPGLELASPALASRFFITL